MKKVRYKGQIYNVEEEYEDSYRLSGWIWVKKTSCEEITWLDSKWYVPVLVFFGFYLLYITFTIILS